MAVEHIVNTSDLHPTYVAQPDMRFATGFLSHEYRDYAVNGESMVDKSSGELFIKRPTDGRVVSFFQNKKYLDELMFELRVLLNCNASFTFPDEDDENAYFLSTNYDLVHINNNRVSNILNNNCNIDNNSVTNQDFNKLRFRISSTSNGFFLRLTSRDCDKAAISALTGEYLEFVKNYSGSNYDINEEKAKLNNLGTAWHDYNAEVGITLLITTRLSNQTFTENIVAKVAINEETFVKISDNIMDKYKNDIKSIEVRINSIDYSKLQMMYRNASLVSPSFADNIQNLLFDDKQILVNYINILSFIDNLDDIITNHNEFIIAMLNNTECQRIMNKMLQLKDGAAFYLSVDRPANTVWNINGVWAERLRDVMEKGDTVKHSTDISFDELEMFLAENSGAIHAYLSDDVLDPDAFIIIDNNAKVSYSEAELASVLSEFESGLYSVSRQIIADSPDTVTENGMVIEKLD